jgi:hypothetical protein
MLCASLLLVGCVAFVLGIGVRILTGDRVLGILAFFVPLVLVTLWRAFRSTRRPRRTR